MQKALAVQVNTHDRSQIEISVDYPPHQEEVFHTDVYFFLPKNFGVNSNSYSRDQFYNDLINHLRFHTPLSQFHQDEDLAALSEILKESTTAQERERLSPLAIQQIKLYGNRANALLKRFHGRVSLGEELEKSVQSLKDLYQVISSFRAKYGSYIKKSSLKLSSELRQALLNSDEFISNRIVATCSDLLQQRKEIKEESNSCYFTAVSDLLLQEKQYRKSIGDLFVDVGVSDREREYFYFRHSLLKKDVASPLYIEKKSSKQEKIYRNWVAGTGAGLAGLWAQIADYQTHHLRGRQDFGLSMFGIGLMAIFIYVFKDRIKDVSKEYINDKMKLFLPDYKSDLEFTEANQNGEKKKIRIGKLSEYMRFLSTRSIPEDISYVRRLKGRRDIGTENQETVIQYHKTVEIKPGARVFGFEKNLCEIKDIHRFNFSYFLNHLDDAVKQISVYDEDEGAAKISAPKVYHINLVSQIRTERVSVYNHFRVILDKEGIVRMETVFPSFQLQHQEGNA